LRNSIEIAGNSNLPFFEIEYGGLVECTVTDAPSEFGGSTLLPPQLVRYDLVWSGGSTPPLTLLVRNPHVPQPSFESGYVFGRPFSVGSFSYLDEEVNASVEVNPTVRCGDVVEAGVLAVPGALIDEAFLTHERVDDQLAGDDPKEIYATALAEWDGEEAEPVSELSVIYPRPDLE
jgi:hypothetical protein